MQVAAMRKFTAEHFAYYFWRWHEAAPTPMFYIAGSEGSRFSKFVVYPFAERFPRACAPVEFTDGEGGRLFARFRDCEGGLAMRTMAWLKLRGFFHFTPKMLLL